MFSFKRKIFYFVVGIIFGLVSSHHVDALTIATDSFTGTASTPLQDHTSDSGHTWVRHQTATGNATLVSGGVRDTSYTVPIYYLNIIPTTAEYDVQLKVSGSNYAAGPAGRIDTSSKTMYSTYWVPTDGWRLLKVVNGQTTILGVYFGDSPATTARIVRLEIKDATKKLFIDGIERVSSTDNSILGKGYAGIYFGGDYDLKDDFLVSESGSPSPAPIPINGTCGTSNNQTLSTIPTSNLCTTGTASTVSGAGPWSWTCGGSNGGTSASCSAEKVVTPTPDTTSPSTPTNLSSSVISTSQINLTWSPSTDNVGVTGYKVYRGGTAIATLGNVTSYQNTGLTPATTYTYTVQALDAANNASNQSTSVTGTTQSTTPTPTPVNGTCGSSNNTTVTSIPTTNLCSTGTASTVSGTGPWTWTCTGSNGGTSASCSANKTTSVTPPPINTGVYYVATTGSDTNTGSYSSPFKTIGKAISVMSGGETVIVRDGIYSGLQNHIVIPTTKSGTSNKYTVVMSENPMGVRIVDTAASALQYYDNQVKLDGTYTKVDGFIFDMSSTEYPPYMAEINGDFNKLTRSIFKRSGIEDNWGGLVAIHGNNNLVEDVAGTGVCRYCFYQGGPTSVTQRNIWRRVVGRFDYSASNQPKATFSTYGNDGGTGVKDHLYQNVIAIDGQFPTFTTGEPKYSGILMVKQATNVAVQGSIVLNEDVGYSGMHLNEYGTGKTSTNSVVWDLNLQGGLSGAQAIRDSNGKGVTANYMTLGGKLPGGFMYSGTELSPSNTSLLIKSTDVKPANLLNNSPGAVIMKRYGVSGTLWGEVGYDQLTNENLWPWPYEDKIKSVFAEINTPPTTKYSQTGFFFTPSVNNTKRGFAADGNGLYGGPKTLTSYIWEYLGTPCPSNICVNGTGVPVNPTPTPVAINGTCGSSNNTTVTSEPTINLCSTGTVSSVAGSGPWTWTCTGSNGGSTASCFANKTVTNISTPTPTPTPIPTPIPPSGGGGSSPIVNTPSPTPTPVPTNPIAPVSPTVPSTPPVIPIEPVSTTIATFTRDLKVGSKGEDVRSLQVFLNTQGFIIATSGAGSPGNETTTFGPATRRSLVRFQVAKKISPVAGYFGPTTRRIVNSLLIQ